MIQNIMYHMEGISIFGLFSICLFFAFFAGMLIWAARLKKDYLKSMGDLPLDAGEIPNPAPRQDPSQREEIHD
jgi:hypothetical protein